MLAFATHLPPPSLDSACHLQMRSTLVLRIRAAVFSARVRRFFSSSDTFNCQLSTVNLCPATFFYPLSFLMIPHSFAQRRTPNPFAINRLRTLSITIEGVPPSPSHRFVFSTTSALFSAHHDGKSRITPLVPRIRRSRLRGALFASRRKPQSSRCPGFFSSSGTFNYQLLHPLPQTSPASVLRILPAALAGTCGE
jgi:hypothetical protein